MIGGQASQTSGDNAESAHLLRYRPSSLRRRIGSVVLLYLGLGLLFGIIIGAPELFLGDYPAEIKVKHGMLIVVGAFVALALARRGARLWRRWPLVCGIICILQSIAAFLVLRSESSPAPGATPIQYTICVVALLGGVLFMIHGISQLSQSRQQTQEEKQMTSTSNAAQTPKRNELINFLPILTLASGIFVMARLGEDHIANYFLIPIYGISMYWISIRMVFRKRFSKLVILLILFPATLFLTYFVLLFLRPRPAEPADGPLPRGQQYGGAGPR